MELASKEKLSETDKVRLKQLREELKDVDMSVRARDPLYKDFIKAMWANEEFSGNSKMSYSRPNNRKREIDLLFRRWRK